jgi:hypothetical protein
MRLVRGKHQSINDLASRFQACISGYWYNEARDCEVLLHDIGIGDPAEPTPLSSEMKTRSETSLAH